MINNQPTFTLLVKMINLVKIVIFWLIIELFEKSCTRLTQFTIICPVDNFGHFLLPMTADSQYKIRYFSMQ